MEFVELLSVKDVTTRIHLYRRMTSSSFDLPYFTFLILDTKQDFRPEHVTQINASAKFPKLHTPQGPTKGSGFYEYYLSGFFLTQRLSVGPEDYVSSSLYFQNLINEGS